MRLLLPLLFFTTVIISSCDKSEDIVPALPPPATPDSTATISGAELPVEAEQPVDSVSTSKPTPGQENYQAQKFGNMPYRILTPRNYDPAKKYPVLIFLHGIGERGTDNEQQLGWHSDLFKQDSIREKYQAFIVLPQCPTTYYWFDKQITENLKGLVGAIAEEYTIDSDRIYITGFSMGAYGTFAMVSQNPDMFAAAIAISGDGDAHRASVMAKTKWRIFAGKKDEVVPSDKSEKMAAALKKSGASVSFTLYPNANHSATWTNAFSEPDFCSWIFSVSRNK
jgi:predicted peptidase